jgi:GxxExxY protein
MERPDLFRGLSYKLVGLAMEAHSAYGPNHKETIYQRALAEKLAAANVNFQREPKIAVLSIDTGKQLGWYQPDFLIDNTIILELKATLYPIQAHELQLRDYLKCTNIELGYLFNFGTAALYYRRIIYTNNLKPFTSV